MTDVVIRISAKNLSQAAFQAARKQLDDLGKTAGLTNTGFAQMGKGFQKAASQLSSFSPTAARATSLLSGFGAAGLAAGVAIGGVGAAVGFGVKSLTEMGDRLTKLSRTTTISTDALQRMEAFGRPLGIALEQMASSSNKLDKALGGGGAEVTRALKILNLEMDDLSAMTADERLRTVQIALSNLNSPLHQAAAGAALLGKSWAEMRLDSASIEEGNAALEGLIVVSEDALKAGDALGDSWSKLWANMEASAAEGSSEIAKALTAIIEGADSALKSISEQNKQAEQQLRLLREGERLAGGGIRMQHLVSGGTSTRGELNAIRQQAAKNIRITNHVAGIQEKADEKRIDDLKKIQAGQRELTDEEQREIEKLAKLHEKAAEDQIKELARISEAHAKAAGEAWIFWDAAYDKIQKSILDADIDSALQGFGPLGFSGGTGLDVGGRLAGKHLSGVAPGVDFSSFGVEEAGEELDEFGLSLESAADLAQIFGDQLGGFGNALLQGAAAGDLLTSALGDIKEGGLDFVNALALGMGALAAGMAIAGATSTGTQGQRAGKGALAGAQAGAAFGPIGMGVGAGIGALVGFLRGRGPAQVGEDAGRDIGAALSQALMEEIHKSGENAQMFLREIFAEGNLGIDRFAEEVGDLFSMFERGEISETGLIRELKETLPILIEHFQELGPAGQEQLERIIQAAQEAGVSIDELGQIIALTLDDDEVLGIVGQLGVTQAAADALGISFGQLGEKVQSIFAPETLETLAANFGATTEEMRQILADLGVNVQTDLERLAASIGLTVEDFQELGAALEESTGGAIGAEELAEFLKQSGLSAADLAASLGVDVTGSLGTVNKEAAGAAAEIGLGADAAGRLAFELERAAAAAANIHIGGIAGFDSEIPTTGAQHGFHGDVTGPRAFVIEPGVRERVDIGPAGSGGTVNVHLGGITVNLPPGTSADHARAMVEILEQNIEGALSRAKSALGIP